MPRSITTAAKNASRDGSVRAATLADFDFGGGVVYVTNAPYTITYNSNDYLGVGDFGKVTPVEEGTEQRAYQLRFELSGIDSSLISTALNEDYQGRDVNLYLALYDTSYQLISDPVKIFAGLMDTMDMRLGQQAVITIVANSRLARWEDAPSYRYNSAAHQSVYPGDLGLEFVEQNVEKEIIWPDR